MSAVKIRLIELEELDEAIALEQRCYTPEAAATLEGFHTRYNHYRSFFWSAWIGEQLVGITNGVRTNQTACGDEMKGSHADQLEGSHFCILTVAVDGNHRRQGIGVMLLRKLVEQCQTSGIDSIILMCEKHLIPFYEAEHFELRGLSSSTHGGIIWYEMSRDLHRMKHLTE
ncbi:GNAT family N-acetyltransferase [Paenibacillus sinopodophylli]|uniref:GNAT family N-acetyltransferase n=1 Tax=Paenibacillus sinopodophylli TaxID=1837342 RepID=UPI00110D22B3|nr:GNAT family N-acetyltransferase [Paenibacillus sinopodophylli]